MKTKFVIYIPVSPEGGTYLSSSSRIAAAAKANIANAFRVTWGSLLTQGWRVVKFEGRKGAK